MRCLLRIRFPAILTHRIAAHLDAVGVVNEAVEDTIDGVDIAKDQLNTVIHEVMHMVLNIHVSDEAKVVAISEAIQPRTRRSK